MDVDADTILRMALVVMVIVGLLCMYGGTRCS